MKKNIIAAVIILIATALFNVSTARANARQSNSYSGSTRTEHYQNSFDNDNGNYNPNVHSARNDNANPASSTSLPINTGVIFLFIAGMSMGIITLNNKFKLSPVKVKA